MDFTRAPKCRMADLAILAPWPSDNSLRGLNEHGEEVLISKEKLQNSVPLKTDEEGQGLYLVIDEIRGPISFHSDPGSLMVHLENGDRALPLNDFRSHAVRVDGRGKVICAAAEPIHEQIDKCIEARADDHLEDLRVTSEALRERNDDISKYEVGMYDIVSSGIDDGMDFLELMKRISDKSHPPLFATHPFFGHVEGNWTEIRNLPPYMLGGVRQVFQTFMQERLGDFPIDRVVMIMQSKDYPLDLLVEAGADLVSEDEPFDGGNFIPNYRTSTVRTYRSEGLEVAVFKDFLGSYAYAYPVSPRYDPEPRLPGR